MLDNIELVVDNYAKEGILFYHDLISCFNGSSFSRIRKLSTLDILFQMINRHGRTHVERHIKYTKKIKLNARRHNVKFRSIQII